MAEIDDQLTQEEEQKRQLVARLGLRPPTLDPDRTQAMPMEAPQISQGMPSLNPSTLDLGGQTNARMAPVAPLGGELPDPNDPKYNSGPRTGKLAMLGKVGSLLLGGPGLESSYSNAPQIEAQHRYAVDLAHAKDVTTQEDTQSQIQERDALAQKAFRDSATKPVVEDVEKQYSDALATGNSVEAARLKPLVDEYIKTTKPPAADKPDTAAQDDQRYEDIQARMTAPGDKPVTAMEQAWSKAYEKRKNLGRSDTGSAKDDARSDRSYQFNSTQLEKERAPVEAQMGKISAALTNIDLKSPQADALLAPQILSLSAGGQGSGLRMNQAELARITGGRTQWESLQAAINKWSLDPTHAQIPGPQRQQMVDIVNAAQQKGTAKQQVIQWAEGALVDADDPKDHRRIVQQARAMLDAVDNGKRIQRNKTTGEVRIAPDGQ